MLFSHPRSDSISLLSVLAAMALRIAPWPGVLQTLNPDWILLTIIYWTLTTPERFGVGRAWLVGLLTDALTGRMLGQYALIYSVVAFLCVKFHRRMRQFPLYQQAVIVFLLLVLSQLLVFWTENLQGQIGVAWNYWLPSWTGAAVWPIIHFAMARLQGARPPY